MVGQVLGNLLNVVLDPLMILGFGWEIAGAAIATVIGNVAAAVYYILFFLRGKPSLSICWRDCALGDGICAGVLSIGIPASLASILMSVSQMVMNSLMADYGDMAVAGIDVAMKVSMITGLICMGIGQGVQPLLGFCVGAKTWERYQKLLRFSLLFAFGLGLCMTGLCTLFTVQIAGGFLTDPEALDYAVQFARILLTTGPLFGLFYVLSNALQAMGGGSFLAGGQSEPPGADLYPGALPAAGADGGDRPGLGPAGGRSAISDPGVDSLPDLCASGDGTVKETDIGKCIRTDSFPGTVG